MASGVDGLEADVRFTADGVPVIFHDQSVLRTTNAIAVFPNRSNYQLRSFTLDELQRLDLGSWMGQQFAGERIVTLQSWLAAAGGRATVNVEIKDPATTPRASQLLAEALAVVPQEQRGRITVSSFDLEWLQSFSSDGLSIRKAVLSSGPPTMSDLQAWSVWADTVLVPVEESEASLVDSAGKFGLSTEVYGVEDSTQLEKALALMPAAILTDYPSLICRLLRPAAPASGAPFETSLAQRSSRSGRTRHGAPRVDR
jgi:glycerophosphoryl diester phosphodiesterase